MDGKLGFIILIAVVACLSLTLALLAGYVFFTSGHQVAQKIESHEGSVPPSAPVLPTDEELVREKLFTDKKFFNLKVLNDGPTTMLQVSGEIVYYKKVPGIKDTAIKIATNKSEMQEVVGKYFQTITKDQVITPEGREKIKRDLVFELNDMLKANEKSKSDIIYNILFDNWFYQ